MGRLSSSSPSLFEVDVVDFVWKVVDITVGDVLSTLRIWVEIIYNVGLCYMVASISLVALDIDS